MQKDSFYFTAGQFARLHQLNKRTLHYYDGIGLFSPAYKGENGYRYYTYRQSAELENILALRELGMSIDEIMKYMEHPSAGGFQTIAAQKTQEIDEQIKHLKRLKALLREKQDALALCGRVFDGKIEVVRLPQEFLLLTPVCFEETGPSAMEQIMAHLQSAWRYSTGRTSCGSYISLSKVERGQFDVYDGLFTPVGHPKKTEGFQSRSAGDYLCGYSVGDWDKIPLLYQRMLEFAAANGLVLTGNCYEVGLNEFAISRMEEYVTRITIQCTT